jgi:coenzyme F420 hydrogenase subunit beta
MTEAKAVEPIAALTCASCGHLTERSEEYSVDIGGRDVLFVADRCPNCGNEYINAPSILIPDRPLLAAFEPEATPIGTYRRVVTVASRDPEFRGQPGDKVAATILGYLLDKGLADAVLLAHQGRSEEPVVAFTKAELAKAWQIRMGPGRAIETGSGLRANLLTLAQIKAFAERDAGEHPRVAVMGRPCQVYTSRKLLWDAYVPGYDLAFALGTFCYGNFAPAAWGARHLKALLGFDPSEIRGVRYGEELQFTSAGGSVKSVPVSEVAGLVNSNCLQCYDFSVKFSDVSIGHVSGDDAFEGAIVRTALGAKVLDGAIKDGYLATSESMYGTKDAAAEEEKAVRFLTTMVDVKRELTRSLR